MGRSVESRTHLRIFFLIFAFYVCICTHLKIKLRKKIDIK